MDVIKLWNDKQEREMYENFADLFAIIKATEKLEKLYVRDVITSSDYEVECHKLIAHFKTLSSTLKYAIPSVDKFHETYKLDCPAAINRLLLSGVPATVEHRAAAAVSSAASASVVAECVQNFITAMDSLKLNMVAVDHNELPSRFKLLVAMTYKIPGVTMYTYVVWNVNCQITISINYFTWIYHFFFSR